MQKAIENRSTYRPDIHSGFTRASPDIQLPTCVILLATIITMAASIPHILLPQRPLVLQHVHYFRALAAKTPRISATCRYASARTPKHQVLEKPTKFNPPSHGRRLKEHIPRHYGPELTQQQKVEQKQKQYPRMMPPPGTFMFWFLTNRNIHTWITLVNPKASLPPSSSLSVSTIT